MFKTVDVVVILKRIAVSVNEEQKQDFCP